MSCSFIKCNINYCIRTSNQIIIKKLGYVILYIFLLLEVSNRSFPQKKKNDKWFISRPTMKWVIIIFFNVYGQFII